MRPSFLLVFLVISLSLVACGPPNRQVVAARETATRQFEATATTMVSLLPTIAVPSPVPTIAHPASPTPQPTTSPTPLPSATPTTEPSNTPSPSPTGTPTATAAPLIGRDCPDPPPLKPAYSRYTVGATPWPTPDPDAAAHPQWLASPFAGGDRLLINNSFPYGWDNNGRLLFHNGIDMAEPLGTPLLAVADGTIVVAGPDDAALYGWRCDWYGHLVVLELDERWLGEPIYILYGHVLNPAVEPGQRVRQGEMVAEVGFGGAATNPHLHLEVRLGNNRFGSTRNPLLWFWPGTDRGIIAGRLVDPEGRPWYGVGISIAGGPQGALVNSWSYLGDPQNLANPDEGWAENFVFGDVQPGQYRLETRLQGITYSTTVEVRAGEVTTVEIITEPYASPSPVPATETAVPDDAGDS